ncbi:zinc-dependent alcohol dehydrogenase family protein [Pseudomonas aeruginosa]|uniref:zinc-dependent alcohol dehydrogenase family protein n=1 Tax=Pseudomonas aeruginosa TaxID=287 RepID=UPI0009A29316|nr:NAD(P)-dependent alcohol dehydrogenase [Pseudomonas aeruginosa]
MNAIELTGPATDRLQRIVLPAPDAPGIGRVHVRMEAASLNYIDLAVATGRYGSLSYPLIPIADGAGEVIAVGRDVWQVKLGDRVAIHSKPYWTAGHGNGFVANHTRGVTERGSLIEIAEVDASSVIKVPDHLGWEAIATLPVAAMTAWRGLEEAGIGPGSTVVVLGTGGVSIIGLQLAKARGARVIVTSSSDDKLERARALGADDTINYRRNPEWQQDVRRLTDGIGADLVVDTAGGNEFGRAIMAVRYGGTVYAVGFVADTTVQLALLSLISNGVRVIGINGGSAEDLAGAVAAIGAKGIHPVIDRVLPLSAVEEGYLLLQRGGHFGKIAITLDW